LRSIIVGSNNISKVYEGLFSRDIDVHRGRLRAPSRFYERISYGMSQFWMDEWAIAVPQCLEVLKQSTVRSSLLLWIRYDICPFQASLIAHIARTIFTILKKPVTD
jgi:hypothetical protein